MCERQLCRHLALACQGCADPRSCLHVCPVPETTGRCSACKAAGSPRARSAAGRRLMPPSLPHFSCISQSFPAFPITPEYPDTILQFLVGFASCPYNAHLPPCTPWCPQVRSNMATAACAGARAATHGAVLRAPHGSLAAQAGQPPVRCRASGAAAPPPARPHGVPCSACMPLLTSSAREACLRQALRRL